MTGRDRRTRAGTSLRTGRWRRWPARRSPRPSRARASMTTDSTAPAPSALGAPTRSRPLADVDRHCHNLDRQFSLQPVHRHRGVEAAAVGQHHSLRHHRAPFLSGPSDPRPNRPPRADRMEATSSPALGVVPDNSASRAARCAPPALSRHHQDRVVTGDRTDHALEPAAVEGRPHHVRRARRGAQHDEVGGVGHLHHPLPEHPAQVVLGCHLVLGQLGQGVDRLAPPGRAP